MLVAGRKTHDDPTRATSCRARVSVRRRDDAAFKPNWSCPQLRTATGLYCAITLVTGSRVVVGSLDGIRGSMLSSRLVHHDNVANCDESGSSRGVEGTCSLPAGVAGSAAGWDSGACLGGFEPSPPGRDLFGPGWFDRFAQPGHRQVRAVGAGQPITTASTAGNPATGTGTG